MLLIAALVKLKAVGSFLFKIVSWLVKPFGDFFIKNFILPVYAVIYGLRRKLAAWYRPAKNRLMFSLSNRYSLHATVIIIAAIAIGVNFQFETVRAETDTFAEKSLLYSIITKEQQGTLEEYADWSKDKQIMAASSYLSDGVLRDTAAVNVPIPSKESVLRDGIISSFVSSSVTNDTVAPRDEVITYAVEAGDTLSTIAEKFGISLNTLLWSNKLTVKSVIKPGNSLKILPVSGVEHTVKSGDTLLAITKKYSASAEDVLLFNKLENSGALTVGQTLVIPGGVQPAPVVAVRPVSTSSVSKLFVAPPANSGNTNVALPEGKMFWPTDLTYIVRGLRLGHTGVDIDCNGHANGTSTNDNYASLDGIVQFSGTKRGYGNVVEINHGNGMVTRYGHFYSLYVTNGQQVTAGTPLGKCGSTGFSSGTHLHFEVMINGRFQNPLNYF